MKDMKKKIKKITLPLVSVVIIIVVIVFINFVSPRFSMKPTETGEILDTGIYAVKNEINSLYFIETDGGYIVIDAGSNADKVKQTLNKINIDPSSVKYVLLTHSDYDHVASLILFPNAQIYMCKDELQMINGTTNRNIVINNSLPKGISINSLNLLKDGQELFFGEHTIKCIETPGHTLGSMTYLLDEYYLFTGDAMMVHNGAISIHPYTMDKETGKKSIQMIEESIKQCNLVLTAHYGYYKPNDLKFN